MAGSVDDACSGGVELAREASGLVALVKGIPPVLPLEFPEVCVGIPEISVSTGMELAPDD